MSEQEAFREWLLKEQPFTSDETAHKFWTGWQACAERKDKIIEQQANDLEDLAERYMKAASECVELEKELAALRERCSPSKVLQIGDTGHYVSEKVYAAFQQQATELAALRGFAARVLSPYVHGDLFKPEAKRLGLIDKNDQPTALLTGESE